MSESKHTPGPWTEHEQGIHPYRYVCGSEEETECGDDAPVVAYVTGANSEANARLIAAAPKLLEALRMIVEGPWPDDVDDPLKQAIWDEKIARAAIALVEP